MDLDQATIPFVIMLANARRLVRILLFALFLTLCISTALLFRVADIVVRRHLDRAYVARIYLKWLCRLCGMRLQVQFAPDYNHSKQASLVNQPNGLKHIRGHLIISNHVSWLDIPVLGSQAPLKFLSKAEVRDWPVIGLIAGAAGTLFIKRGSGQSESIKHQIQEKLAQNQNVLVFPEGTTSDGTSIKRMHPRLLASACNAEKIIQPLTVMYLDEDNRPSRIAPFIGDDEFHKHVWRLFGQARVTAAIEIHPPVTVTPETDIAEVTHKIQQRMQASIEKRLGSPPLQRLDPASIAP